MTVLNVEDLEGYILGQPPKGTPDSARQVYADLTGLFPAQPGARRGDRRAIPAPRIGGGLLGGLKRLFSR